MIEQVIEVVDLGPCLPFVPYAGCRFVSVEKNLRRRAEQREHREVGFGPAIVHGTRVDERELAVGARMQVRGPKIAVHERWRLPRYARRQVAAKLFDCVEVGAAEPARVVRAASIE